jgi:hypothetical protein
MYVASQTLRSPLLTAGDLLKCHRMVTVRELARSQGFPDSFVFYTINDNVVTVGLICILFSTSSGFDKLIPSDAPTNWKCSSLARFGGYWTRAARGTV